MAEDNALAETVEGSEPPLASSRRASAEAPSPFDPPAPSSRFVEAAELGRGGMGRVFEAVDTALDRQVAIKQSLADDPQLLARFEREVRITAKLQHPGIVPVLDAGRDAQGRPYYVMRRIEGKPLSELIARAATLEDRLALVPNVLSAVDAAAYAHSRGVIHRDIKPWNVLVGPFGETLLIDWGLARELGAGPDGRLEELRGVPIANSELTRAGSAYGTPGFMPPEQARGESLDRRADVFALGATLYHVVSGNRPIQVASPTEALDLAASGQPRPALPEGVPAELRAIVSKAMSPDREQRYPDAGALAEDLRRFTTGQLVAAHRYTARDLVWRWMRRHRIALSITSIAVIVLGVVAVISIRNVMAARDAADEAAARAALRADELVLEHAESLASHNPTHAVARLRELREGSSAQWARASAILDTAIARGVARGKWAHPGSRNVRLAASPDGTAVVSISDDGLLIHDPELRSSRPLSTITGARVVTWVERNLILVGDHERQLHLVSLDGRSTIVATGYRQLLESHEGRAYALFTDRSLRQIDIGHGITLPRIEAVDLATRVDHGVVYANARSLVFHPDDGAPVELLSSSSTLNLITRAHDGRRFAVATQTEVVEWDLATGKPVERGRWSIVSESLIYVSRGLLVMHQGRAAWLIPKLLPLYGSALSGIVNARQSGPECSFVSTWSGTLWQLCPGFEAQLSRRSEIVQSLALTKEHLVGATPSGLLMSWPRAPLSGVPTVAERPVPMTFFTGSHVFSHSNPPVAIDLGSGRETDLGIGVFLCTSSRFGVLSSTHGADPPDSYVIDLHTLAKTPLGKPNAPVSCSRQGRLAVSEGRRLEIRDLANPRVVQHTLEAPFAVVASYFEDEWLVILGAGGKLARIDLRSGAISTAPFAPEGRIVVDRDGRVALARATDARLWLVDGRQLTLPIANTVELVVNPAGIVFVHRDKSLTVVDDGGRMRKYQHGTIFMPTVAIDRPFAVMPGIDGDIVILDLRDGRTRRIPVEVRGAIIDHEGTRVSAWHGRNGMTWKIPPDRTREEVRETIDRITNATLRPGDTRVAFP